MELTATVSMAMAAILAVFILSSLILPRVQRKALNLPPGPRGLPVIGSLGVLAGALPPHRALAELAARYGPLMHLRLGSYHAVVASSAETARLVLKTHDLALADRPPTTAGELMSYGYRGIVHTPYGAYWRMARKLCATELFSPRRVASFERVRAQEMRALVRGVFLAGGDGAAVAVREHVAGATLRNILRMAVGEKWSGCYGSAEGEAFRRTLDEAFAVTGAVSNVGEWVPWLGWLDVQGCRRRMRRLHRLYDQFYEKIVDEHEERRRRAEAGEFVASDLVDVLLQLAEEEEEDSNKEPSSEEARLTRVGVKAFIQDIIAGGTESSAVTIEWAMSELLRHPDAMASATDELDRVVGPYRWVTEGDLPNLPYVDAVVKETLRLHPVGPLLVPHHAREDTVVVAGGNYDVPAGARVLVNAWAIARDPASWPDAPGEFRPERFLKVGAAADVDVRGAHFELLPFGAGRRICPAYDLAMKLVAAGVANLVQGFAWRLPDGVKTEDVSMEEHVGLSTRRKVPLVAVAEPRLPAHLYAATD
ncbi:hypothetical protein HU200_063888 [Digitaria exilis]|uniref:trimethyltridecatetraene synthase n=1 Tax=Digitaria exilis TaxID=1010633 RepID=A0A835A553_9POAL|nr:hypothetical protein HU200_063888 [Digitaria exilis]